MSSSSLNVDQRIVQMQFDNAQFEQGVTTTMGTLDKLKNSLNFTGQANGIENLSKSFGKVNANPLISAVETAKGKFSALEIAAITAISNITTKVQMMGERIVSAVTIDPVKTGWSEYEQKMDSIKTILNSAKDENGMAVSLDQVKKKIEDLNAYADKTIYSFSDMTNNIGKFTNAGVDLNTAVDAIQGVANAAAAAGADSNAASRAMYNFAQSLSVGYMQRMDWKSIENANMATTEFKDELLKTAEAMGTVKKDSNGMYTSLTASGKKAAEATSAAAMFTEKLSTKWLTNDVLIKTLRRYSDTSTDIGKKAEEAATKVFTLSKMFDTLKEAMQSGWSATWEKIVGDYEQAGELFTGINDFISGAIGKRDQKRIDFLDELLNKADTIDKKEWDMFKFDKDKEEINMFKNAIKQAAREQGIEIDKMITKNQGFRESLKEGWLTDDILKKAQSKLKEYNKILESDRKKAAKDGDKKHLSEFEAEAQHIENLSKSIKDLGEATDKTGRELLLESFKKIFDEVMRVYNVMKSTYETVFPKSQASDIYKILQAIRDWTNGFSVSTTALYRFRDILKGVFSVAKLFTDVIKMVGDIVWSIAGRFRRFGEMVLSVAGSIGRMVDNFRQSAEQGGKFKKIVEIVTDSFDNLTKKINDFVNGGSITEDNWLGFKNTLSEKDQKTYIKAVKKVAREHGINVDEMIGKNGTFEESLRKGWFTKDLFNEVNYYFENITRKGTTGVKVWSNEEFKALKRIRKQLNDNESAYSKMGESAGKAGSELVMEKVEKFSKPLSGVLDRIIEVLPKVLKTLGSIASFIGGRIFGGAKLVWKIITNIYNVIANISEETKNDIKKNIDGIRDFLKKIYNIGKDIVKKIVDKIKINLPTIKEDFKVIGDKAKELKNALKGAYDNIKDFVNKAGEMMDIKGVVKNVAKFFTSLANLTFDALLWAIDKITDFFKYISGNKTVNKVFTALGDSLIKVFTKLESGVAKVKTFVGELLKLETVQKAIENVKTFFKDLGSTFVDYGSKAFGFLGDLFKLISDHLPSMETSLGTINGLLDGTVNVFKLIGDSISNFFGIFKKKEEPNVGFGNLGDVKDSADEQAENVDEAGNTIKDSLTAFASKIEEGMGSLTGTRILHGAAWIGLIWILYNVAKAAENLKLTLGSIKNWASLDSRNPITKFITSLTGALKAYRKQVDANSFYAIAKGIGIIALAIFALAQIEDTEKVTQIVADLFILVLSVSLVIKLLNKLFKDSDDLLYTGAKSPADQLKEAFSNLVDDLRLVAKKALKLIGIGAGFAGIAAGVGLLVATLFKLYAAFTGEGFDWNDFQMAILIVVGSIAALCIALRVISKNTEKLPMSVAASLLAFGFSIKMITSAMLSLTKATDDGKMITSIVAFGVILFGLVKALDMLQTISNRSRGRGTSLTSLAASVVLLALAIDMLIIPIAALSAIANPAKLLAIGAAIGIIALCMGGLAKMAENLDPKNAAGILIIGVALRILMGSLKDLSTLDSTSFNQLASAVSVLILAMLGFAVFGQFFEKGMNVMSKAFIAFGIAAAGFGAGVYLVSAGLAILGPALESVIDGLVVFSKKLVENAPIITLGLITLIGIICTGIMASTSMLTAAGYKAFTGIFTGIGKAVTELLPKSKGLLIAGIFVLVTGVLGFLEMFMPGITDRLIGLLVTGINAIAKALINRSHGLALAIGNLIKALLVVLWEIVSTILEGIGKWLEDEFPGLFKVFQKNLEENRTWFEDQKTSLIKSIDASDEIKSVTERETAALDERQRELQLHGAMRNEQRDHGGSSGKIPDGSTENPEEPGQKGYKDGSSYTTSLITGAKDTLNSMTGGKGIDFSQFIDSDGAINIADFTGSEMGGTLLASLQGSLGDVSAIGKDTGVEILSGVTEGMSKEEQEELWAGLVDLAGEKGSEAGKSYIGNYNEAVSADVGKSEDTEKTEKITTKQDVTLTASVNTEKADEAMVDAAKKMMAKYGETIKSEKDKTLKPKMQNAVRGAANAAKDEEAYGKMKSAGKYIMAGLIEGVDSKINELNIKADEVARIVARIVEKKNQIKSPSRVMFKLGEYIMQGYINGISSRIGSLEDASVTAASVASDNARSALAQVSAMLSSDIDSTPTIRPVLDLSDVAKGAGQINGMLNGRTFSVNSMSANMLSASMNARQNRTDPVLSAINNLANNLNNQQPANVYNLNGITYDDGSNIATAIGMLAHAAVVEGRA